MTHFASKTHLWAAAARRRLGDGAFCTADLDELDSILHGNSPRQRLLYLHARDPSVTADVIGWAEHPGEDPGGVDPVRPYATVVAAIQDGWRAIHFPQQLAPFDDRETDLVGYEFILERFD